MNKNKKKKRKPSQPPHYDKNEEWVKDYEKQFGEEPSFF